MSSLFAGPSVPKAVPVVNPADTSNRINDALAEKLSQGGTNSTLISPFATASTGGGKAPTLTGLS